MRKMAIAAVAGAMLAGMPFIVGTARAELEVKRSSAPSVKVGDKLSENSKLSVPSGAEIEFFKLPAGPTYTVKGPYEGTLANYSSPCPWWKAVVGSCKQEEFEEGGSRGVAPEVPGGTRGIKRPSN